METQIIAAATTIVELNGVSNGEGVGNGVGVEDGEEKRPDVKRPESPKDRETRKSKNKFVTHCLSMHVLSHNQ